MDLLPSITKYVISLLVVASFLVTEAASAKCSSASISDRFSEASPTILWGDPDRAAAEGEKSVSDACG